MCVCVCVCFAFALALLGRLPGDAKSGGSGTLSGSFSLSLSISISMSISIPPPLPLSAEVPVTDGVVKIEVGGVDTDNFKQTWTDNAELAQFCLTPERCGLSFLLLMTLQTEKNGIKRVMDAATLAVNGQILL